MAAPTFYSNWPTFNHRHQNVAVPSPSELLPFHDNFTLSDTYNINYHSPSFNNNNLQFHNPVNYPTLSSLSSYSPPPLLPDLTFNHEYYSNIPIVPDVYDDGELFPMNPPDYYSYPSYPVVNDVCSMENMQQELPPLPEIYADGVSSGVMLTSYGGGRGFNGVQSEEKSVEMKDSGDGCVRLSAQSMAARVRRRKISEKTSELGKLVPGGHRMSTAEMFQAAFKYVKFLQAQVGVLQLMPSSPGLGLERQALLTCPLVQEKLYIAGKCIVTRTLGETLVEDRQETKN